MEPVKKGYRNKWLLSVALAIPVILYFINYWIHHEQGLIPTGFIQYDNVGYIAYAKQYLDADKLQLQYANPFDIESTPIYFQPQTLFFAFLLKCRIPTSVILPIFTIICSVICFRLLIAIYEQIVVETHRRKTHLILLSWGGGLFFIAGMCFNVIRHGFHEPWQSNFILDPEYGWWGLNFGRSILFSCEAYYHALFLGCIYALLLKNYKTSAFLLLLISLSHPFTGIELILIVMAWATAEKIIFKSPIPVWFIAIILLIMIFHLYYYLVYLNSFPDHKSVSSQYALNWRLRYYRIIPAYAIVGTLAANSIYNFRKKTANPHQQRLFFSWFVIAFILANHELFIKAQQPVHFTRGYIWTALFLIGLPALINWTTKIKTVKNSILFFLFCTIFLLDNIAWFGENMKSKAQGISINYINSEVQNIFTFINKKATNKSILISQDNNMAYLGTVYTMATPLFSHPYTTPFASDKLNIQNELLKGNMNKNLLGKDIFIVLNKNNSNKNSSLPGFNKEFESGHYIVLHN